MRKGYAHSGSRSGDHQTYAYAPFPQGQSISMPQAMAVPKPGNDSASFGHRGLRARRSPPEDHGGDFQRADRTSRERPSRARRRGGHEGMGDGDDGNPSLEPRSSPQPALASRLRKSTGRCKSQVKDLVARERAETPRTGGRMGPGHRAAAPQRCGIARCRT